jgi:hypothetical protein
VADKRLMAALVESLAAITVGRRRKGRNLQRGGAGGGCHYHRQGDEFIGRLSRCLSQHEEGCGGKRSSGERKRRERKMPAGKIRKVGFWPTLDLIFFILRP